MVHNPQKNAEPPGRVFISVKGKVPEGIQKGSSFGETGGRPCVVPHMPERISAADDGEDAGQGTREQECAGARQVGGGQQHFILC